MAVDKKYLKEAKLENVYKRMRQINEYVITNGYTNEADDFQTDDKNDNNQNPQQMPNDNMNQPQGGDMMNGMPNNQPAPDTNSQSPQDNSTPQGDMGNNQGMNDPMMDAPAAPDPTIGAEAPENNGEEVEDIDIEGEDTDTAGADDEVVDVDELTNSQEAAEYKIDGVDDKLSKLLAIAGKFAQAIQDNDDKINDLKAEIEKRNPTDTERINIRSQNSQPFSVNPGAYWDGVRAKNPNYQVISDNEVSPNEEDKVYTITDDDLKDFNTSEVEKSFSDFPKDLMDYFK